MDYPERQAAAADLERQLGELLERHRPGAMLTGFLTMVEYLDDDGEPSYLTLSPVEARAITSLGQAHALVKIAESALFDDDDEP